MKDWIIKKLGGYTKKEFDLNNQKWENIILDDSLLLDEKLRLTTNQYYEKIFIKRMNTSIPHAIGKFMRSNNDLPQL